MCRHAVKAGNSAYNAAIDAPKLDRWCGSRSSKKRNAGGEALPGFPTGLLTPQVKMQLSVRSHQGRSPELGARVYIDPAATVIGNVQLGDDVSVWPGAVIRGDMHSIAVGSRSNVQDNAVLHVTHASSYNPDGWPVIVGEDVVVGHRAILHGCTLRDRILIGIGAILNDGVTVEDEVIVGAGCLVPPGKLLESGYVYVGNPYKRLRPITDQERDFFRYSAGNYVRLKDKYLAEL